MMIMMMMMMMAMAMAMVMVIIVIFFTIGYSLLITYRYIPYTLTYLLYKITLFPQELRFKCELFHA